MSCSSVVDSVMKKHFIKLKHDKSSTTSSCNSRCVALVKDCEHDDVKHTSAFDEQNSPQQLKKKKSKNPFGMSEVRKISMEILKAAENGVQR